MSEPCRVLQIFGNLQRGGVEAVVFNYFRAIDRSRVMFDLVIDETSPCDVPEDVKGFGGEIYRIPPYTKPRAYISAIKSICRSGGYRIVHSHMNTMSVFPLYAAWRAGVPVRIAHNHSTAAGGNDFKRDMLKYALRPFAKVFATDYFACGEYAGRWLFGNRTFNAGKVTVLNNAIDTRRFAFSPDTRSRTRRELGVEDRFVVGHIGRFVTQKNHERLLDIFAAVCALRDDAELVLVGGTGSPAETRIRERVSRMGLDNRVRFMGTVENTGELYQAFDVFCLPSLYEGLPLVALEAQVSGLPCVMSDRVTREAKLIDSAKFIPLAADDGTWARAVCAAANEERRDCSQVLADAGYEITREANKLTDYYENAIGGGST